MKVLFIINSLSIGGAEKMVTSLSVSLKRYVTIDILVLFPEINEFWQKYLLEQKIRILKISRSCKNPLFIYDVYNIVKQGKYDVVHTHLTYAQFCGALISYLSCHHTRYVTTEHSNFNNRRRYLFFKYLDRWMYGCYDKVLSISPTVQMNLCNWLGNNSSAKYSIFPNGVDVEMFRLSKSISRNEIGYNSNDIILMMVGRLADAKDPITIMKALQKLPLNYKLILIGDGPLKTEFINKAKSLEVYNRVNFCGNRNDVNKWLKIADIYIQSSHWEGMPTALLEAMASGTLCLASKVPGNVDVLKDEMLFNHEDPDDLIRKIYSVNESWHDIQKDIIDKYDINVLAKQLIDLYKRL